MGVTWDKLKVYITNNTSFDMTLADKNLNSGKWGDDGNGEPKKTIAAGAEEKKAFTAQSRDDATVGPSGYVTYGIPDGTEFKIIFNIPYNGTDEFDCTISGAGAANYDCETELKHDHSGAEKNDKGYVTVEAAS